MGTLASTHVPCKVHIYGYLDKLHAYATFRDAKELLFFTRTDHGRSEAKAFAKRLNERTSDRDTAEIPVLDLRPR